MISGQAVQTGAGSRLAQPGLAAPSRPEDVSGAGPGCDGHYRNSSIVPDPQWPAAPCNNRIPGRPGGEAWGYRSSGRGRKRAESGGRGTFSCLSSKV